MEYTSQRKQRAKVPRHRERSAVAGRGPWQRQKGVGLEFRVTGKEDLGRGHAAEQMMIAAVYTRNLPDT